MKIQEQELVENKLGLEVEVEAEKVDQALDRAYKEVANDVQLPGFRKGKVPRPLLESHYGKDILHKDAVEILMKEIVPNVLKALENRAISMPELADYELQSGQPATFNLKIEVMPEVELGKYKDLGIKKEEVGDVEGIVDSELERLQQEHSKLVNSEREIVEENDFIIIDYYAEIEGEEEPNIIDNYGLTVGSGQLLSSIESQLVGLKREEEAEIEASYPEDYSDEGLRGKGISAKVVVKEIKEESLPSLDDDFASQVTDYRADDLEELKDKIRESTIKRHEMNNDQQFKENLMAELFEQSEVDLPERLIENETKSVMERLKGQLGFEDDVSEMYQMKKGEIGDFVKFCRQMAINNIKLSLIYDAVAKKEGITVDDEEVNQRILELAEQQDQDPKELKKMLIEEGRLSIIKDATLSEKVEDFLMQHNPPVMVSSLDDQDRMEAEDEKDSV